MVPVWAMDGPYVLSTDTGTKAVHLKERYHKKRDMTLPFVAINVATSDVLYIQYAWSFDRAAVKSFTNDSLHLVIQELFESRHAILAIRCTRPPKRRRRDRSAPSSGAGSGDADGNDSEVSDSLVAIDGRTFTSR